MLGGENGHVATPDVTVLAEHPLIEEPLLRKLTVPVAAALLTVAVNVSITPKGVDALNAVSEVVVGVENP
jgi:hypothetical protein